MTSVVVGVDSSTSGCKVEVRDLDTGTLVASGQAAHPMTTPPRSEQHPASWLIAFQAACVAAGVGERYRPAAIAVGGQQHGLVALDATGAPLRPAKLWNDTESAPDADQLLEELDGGAAAWANACGSVPVPSFTITKLRWLRRREPDVFARLAKVMLPHDWLTYQLSGRVVTDRGDASGTGYWSPRDDCYRFDLLGLVDPLLDWTAMVPEVLGPADTAGEWAEIGAIVAPGTGDNMAAALGLGLRPGDLVLSLGTSGTTYTVSRTPREDATGAVAGFADATGRYLPLVCTLNATKVTDAAARLLGVGPAQLDELALAAPPGAGGLVLVPHLDGERTPNRPDATGTLAGIRSDVTREQLARAAIEGVVCNLLAGADRLAEFEPGVNTGRVFLVGGGSRSAAYQQIVADLLDREVTVPDDDQVVALGAAVQAAAVLTGCPFDDIASAWEIGSGQTVSPHDVSSAAAVRARYAGVVDGLTAAQL